MKALLVDENAKIYPQPEGDAISIATMKKDDPFEVGRVIRKKGKVWVAVALPSGLSGYIPGETRIFAIKQVQLLHDSVEIVTFEGEETRTVKTCPKGTILLAVGVEKNDAGSWVKVQDEVSGLEGYIRGSEKIKVFQTPTKSGGKKTMITGAIFTVLGVLVYFMGGGTTGAAGTSSLLYFVIIALGLVQVFQGYTQYRNAVKMENNRKDR